MLKQDAWDDAKRVFDAALALDPVRRDAYLRDVSLDAPELVAEVRSLLEWHEEAPDFLEVPAARLAAAAGTDDRDPLVGQALGPWRVTGLLGRGGMGVVYFAERADDAFSKHVALKVLRNAAEGAAIVERFRRERETLASLEHPNIARLLDGGTTPGGEPFYVMELVEGRRVDQYCDDARLSVDERLRLFRTICHAVQHAHQNLVVHRDLKPDNILVTRDGTPKLLDFGIATLLSEPSSQIGRDEAMATWLLTPDYASPEQLAGRGVTTASDVYSLGVLLYVLLTGQSPYRLAGTSPEALRAELSASPFVPPSVRVGEGSPDAEAHAAARGTDPRALARRLSGDLDAIVARALSRDPAARYRSVEGLVEDLDRHRSHRPIAARPSAPHYVAGRFIRRHALAVAAGAAMLVLGAAGVAGVLWQAALASEARTRAERRFNDVRQLAHTFMFDVHDEIVNLPGTTRARELMVRTASQYLQSLVPESSGDLSLQRELAAAFVRLGDAQGHPNSSSLGDSAAARASYEEAIRIADALRAMGAADTDTVRSLAMAHRKLADVLAWTGELPAALAACERSRQLLSELAADEEATDEDHLQRAVAEIKLGDLLGNPNFPNLGRAVDALPRYEAALRMLRAQGSAGLPERRLERYLGITFERIGSVHERLGRSAEAAAAYEESFGIRFALAGALPLHTDVQRDLAIAYEKIGNVRSARGDMAGAVESYRGALAQFERLAEIDPSNATAARSVAIGRENLARALSHGGQTREAGRELTLALEAHRRLAADDASNVQARCDVARVAEDAGDLAGAGRAACGLWRSSLELRRELSAAGPRCAAAEDVDRLTGKLRQCS